jgi:YesN/AraC family two-component response regulator
VDIIVSDVVMPRMTGVELAHTVLDEFPRVPVILVSGYTSVECAPFPFLSKPFELPQLVGIITETLASGEAKA